MGKWEAVTAELEAQLRIPPELHFSVETRNRSTMQCQRLLRDQHVELAVPVVSRPRPDSDDRKGRFVIAFTELGPWLFSASGGNPGLPRRIIGEIEDAAPITFSPHEREGGVLTLGDLTFLVPYLHADNVRNLIVAMSQRTD